MPEYKVVWEVDLSANTPLEAAKEARLWQQDPYNEAGFFRVFGKELPKEGVLINALKEESNENS